jgi:hypothetical protein
VSVKSAMRKGPGARGGGKNGAKSRLLENAVDNLRSHGFQIYTNPQFQDAAIKADNYVIRGYPHKTVVHGMMDLKYQDNPRHLGKKEGLIVSVIPHPVMVPDEDGITRIVIEAKNQNTSGSKDEAMLAVWHMFIASDVRNWTVLVDGNWWKTPRGAAFVKWLKERPGCGAFGEVPKGRSFSVMTPREFSESIHLWLGSK